MYAVKELTPTGTLVKMRTKPIKIIYIMMMIAEIYYFFIFRKNLNQAYNLVQKRWKSRTWLIIKS
jgi:hypothetical protein